jgi:hypothetical protein
MGCSPAIAARLATLVLVSAGAGLYAAVGAVAKQDPAAPYLGMSVTDILACAGEPHSRFESGPNKETLTFRYSGAGPVPAEKPKADDKKADDKKSDKNSLSSIFGKNKKKEDKDWTCSASLVFEDGKLVRVNFAHKDVHSPYDWQAERDPVKQEEKRKEGVPTCEFSLPKCAR